MIYGILVLTAYCVSTIALCIWASNNGLPYYLAVLYAIFILTVLIASFLVFLDAAHERDKYKSELDKLKRDK